MDLLILLTGHKDKLLQANGLNAKDVEVVKVDEKRLSEPGYMLRLIKSKPYKRIYFGCIDLDLQRFHTFMKIYLLLSGFKQGSIIDESGRANKFNFMRLLFIELPGLAAEIIASLFVVAFYYIKLPFLRWYLCKKS